MKQAIFIIVTLLVCISPIFADSSWSEGADINRDGTVNIMDLSLLVEHWLDEGCLWPDWCGNTDINLDGSVSINDYAILAKHWLATDPRRPVIMWVYINDSGFIGYMSIYEITNAQYAHYLNAALDSNDIRIEGSYVKGNSGPYSGDDYYRLDGPGWTGAGAVNGGASRISYSDGVFTVAGDFEHHPVTYVSWYGATAFASYFGWQLPTEWQWQAVADYDGNYIYATGSSLYDSQKFLANCGANGSDNQAPNDLAYHPWVEYGTSEVAYFGAFGYGLADMAGNVWEWTSSLWSPAPDSRVLRGGSWSNNDYYCLVSGRYYSDVSYMNAHVGFRICR
jgi:formylglycine-generating enzyme required for sulfatase activity